jgi:hypothetical protein
LKEFDAIVAETDEAAKMAKGEALYKKISMAVAHHLEHMNHEESTIMPVLNKHYTNEELWKIHVSIGQSIPPPVMNMVWILKCRFLKIRYRSIC